MTEHTHTVITCDGPSSNHRWVWSGQYAGTVANAMEYNGWIERDGKHYCPECTKEIIP